MKILGILVVEMLLFSGFGIAGIDNNGTINNLDDIETMEKTIAFSKPKIIDDGKYVKVMMEEANYILRKAGNPVLPVHSTIIKFPLGIEIVEVRCTPINIKTMELSKKISPFKINGNDVAYPKNWYDYKIGGGLENGERIAFLSINFHPVRYHPLKNKIEYVKKAKIEVTYEKSKPLSFPDEYDMLIISPFTYKWPLKKLVEHKLRCGIKAKVVTLPEIYFGVYFPVEGRDRAEKIKYFIKNAVEEWGINYVLLVGGTKRIPAREAYIYEGSEKNFLSDLYYADIYFPNGSFSSWDTNQNCYYGEYNHSGKMDKMDLYPDVYLGRLPCRNIIETFFTVKKMIGYDENEKGEWFNRMVVCAGDSFNDSEWGTDYIEGEITTEKSLEYMEGFIPIRIYASRGNLSTENIIKEFNKGAGFIHLDGHGNYLGWATHPIHDYDTWIGFSVYDLSELKNNGKLPVVVVGGCHTSDCGRFYECFGWKLIRKIGGGAIATTGYTSLSWGADDDVNGNGSPDIIEYASGFLNTLFFKKYGKEEREFLGEAFGEAIIEYLNKCPVKWNNEFLDIWDCKTVASWILFGDPSMKIVSNDGSDQDNLDS